MCRLFGFRSVILSKVHTSLVSADNALMQQSSQHPDGWGVAYYHAGAPHVIRSVSTAVQDRLFKQVSGLVSSETVVAHLRKATNGDISILNTHPFQYGRWTFAHNGNIKAFAEYREALIRQICPRLQRFVLGETDSEILFLLLLTHIQKQVPLISEAITVAELVEAIRRCVDQLVKIIGPYHEDDSGAPTENYLTFIITNGTAMVAHQGGKDLYYSTYKKRCSERDTCASFGIACEAATPHAGKVNHLIISSEPLSGQNLWVRMVPGAIVGVDGSMTFWSRT